VARIAGELGYAAYWWAVLAAFGMVTWLLVVALPIRALRHALLHRSARAFFTAVRIPVDVEHETSIPKQNAIIVANHSSYLDGLVATVAIPGELFFVAKAELRRQLVTGLLLKRLGAIFVRRVDPKGGLEDTDAVLRTARSGGRIVTFPEGTFTRMPGLLPFRLGAFHVAAQARIPVFPMTIRGTRSILRGGQLLPRRGRISVHIGEPMLADGDDFGAALRLRDKVRAFILAKSGELDLAREQVELPPD
jgi:1-acyl-sn-glycerol-3-phosphate acyltransferase